MNILIACEESQEICKAFREKGHAAFSCDIEECSGGHPEWHIKDDCLKYINGNCVFETMDGEHIYVIDGPWDLIIAHPPCTYLAISGNRYFNEERYGDKAKERKKLREEAYDFFMQFVNADCEHIAIENPVGYMNSHYRKPDQIIQPYQFGHPVSKRTCLWLKNLPKLQPTEVVEPEKVGKNNGYSGNLWYAKDENGKTLRYSDPQTAKLRSKTYHGIALAIADQWGNALCSE